MAHLKEGQDFSRFTLLDCISESEVVDTWQALDRELNERVYLKLYKNPIAPENLADIQTYIAKSKGLIHQNIVRTFEAGEQDGVSYISQQYVKNGRPFELEGKSFSECWPIVNTLIDTLAFTHSLGLAHGSLNPGSLIQDETGNLRITGFGIQLGDDKYPAYRSPNSDDVIDLADDVYALGALVHRILAGQELTPGSPDTGSLPADVQAVILSMVEISDYDRTRDLDHVREVLSRHADAINPDSSLIADNSFAKPNESPQVPPEQAAHHNIREHRQVPTSVALVGLMIIIGLAGFVFLYLPGNQTVELESAVGTIVEPQTKQTPIEDQPKVDELAPMEIAQIEFAKEEGKSAASQVIRLQVELEDLGIVLWAKEQFDALTNQAISGDDLYREEQYREALAVYRQTIEELQQLVNSAEEILANNIKSGDAALAQGDADQALTAFIVATAIDREDQSLKDKLDRAENLQLVLASMKSGEAAEKNGEFDAALTHFTKARDLDSLWEPAQQGIVRLEGLIRQRRFEDAMSSAFSALARKDYDQSRTAFKEAATIIPDSTEPEDGILQIDLAVRMDEIDTLKEAADRHVSEESWAEAIEQFEAVLALDSSLIFAHDGLAVAKERLDLESRLKRFLNDPTIMKDDGELNSAKRAVVDASRVARQSPNIAKQMNSLSRLISVARIPINVVITSDGRTDVTVYQIRHLGKIDSTDMQLYPGTYTIVGKRSGYRDVQHTLRLMAGTRLDPINIKCVEKI